MDDRDGAARREGWGLPLALLLSALVLVVTDLRLRPLAPLGAEVGESEISAARMSALLEEIDADGAPHPTGSPENARVRDAVIAVLERLGYAPEVQRAAACHYGSARCGVVENVVARLPGTGPDDTVLLAAHYDSVGAGPGVADDLSGIAVLLEVARILKAGPPPRNSVVFALLDGEEQGLLGSEAFMAGHPLAREIDVALNLEARGTAGPSLMFETGPDDAALVALYAGAATRPIATSLFATIYDLLPNDTDFTVFQREGVRGLNFAFVEGPQRYHSAIDDLAHLSLATLQHHGDNALTTARALASVDLEALGSGSAVFFDVFGLGVVRWPMGWTLPLALAALALVIAAAVRLVRRGGARGAAVALGTVSWLAVVLGAAVVGVLLRLALGALGGLGGPSPWLAEPLPARLAFWLAGLAAALAVAALFARRTGGAGLWAGVWLVWALLAVAAAVALPGVSHLLLVPALAAGLAGLLLARRPGSLAVAALVPLLTAVLLWAPLLLLLEVGMGTAVLPAVAALTGVVATGLAPLVAEVAPRRRRALALGVAALAAAAGGVALTRPAMTPDEPRLVNVLFVQDAGAGTARVAILSPRPPDPMRRAAAFEDDQVVLPWSPGFRRPAAPAATIAVPAPELTLLEDVATGGERRMRVRLASRRGTSVVGLALPGTAGVRSVAFDGARVAERAIVAEGWGEYDFVGAGPEGVEVEIVLRQGGAAGPLEAWVYDLSSDLPPAGRRVAAARPATAVPGNRGDVTIVARKAALGPLTSPPTPSPLLGEGEASPGGGMK